jgi:hypothetical protein
MHPKLVPAPPGVVRDYDTPTLPAPDALDPAATAPAPSAERALRFFRRYRAAVTVAALAISLIAALGALSVRRVMKERDRADERADDLTLVLARTSVEEDPRLALTLLHRLSPRFSRVRVARMIAADARAHRVAVELRGHRSPINDVAFSPDGRTLATSSDDRSIRL